MRSASGTITDFDVPGSTGTIPVWINTTGTISGTYGDSKAVIHGFTRSSSGTFTTLSAPGAGTTPGSGTFAFGINAAGQVVGYFDKKPNAAAQGYVWTP